MLTKNKNARTEEVIFPKIIGIIASKNPTSALSQTVESLIKGGASSVVVVDDGSDDPSSFEVFERVQAMGAVVVHLKRNVGKAAALKEAFKMVPADCVIVQTDDDTLAGNLLIPLKMLVSGKADIIDIRVETNRTKTVIGHVQELCYWIVNVFIKRIQDLFRARLWMSGASVMYSYRAGSVLLLKPSYTVTEDTEGLFRARKEGMRIRSCFKKEAQFITMVPENFHDLNKQWQRWALGNGQVMGIYGLGGGLKRVSLMNAAWISLLILPIPLAIVNGAIRNPESLFAVSFIFGIIGAIVLRRFVLVYVSVLLPFISLVWIIHAVSGMFRAIRQPMSKGNALAWVSPKRTAF